MFNAARTDTPSSGRTPLTQRGRSLAGVNVVHPSEDRDLAVEVVSRDNARAALQALPLVDGTGADSQTES